MPASNLRALDKARSLPCDTVVIDLEDAVAPDQKLDAREQAVATVAAGGFGSREIVIRVNALSTEWGHADLAALTGSKVDAVLAPKISSAEDVHSYHALLDTSVDLWAMIETCGSLFALSAIGAAAVDTRLCTFVVGTNDLSKEMGCRLDRGRTPLFGPLSLIVAAARLYGIAVIDGVFNDINDESRLRAECIEGMEFGFDGKSLIHPSQIALANEIFAPSAEELEWSHAVVRAFAAPDAQSKGALRLNGKMVERLHLEQAERTIALSEAIAAAAPLERAGILPRINKGK